METVAIVILNYLNYKDTIECIESIESDLYLQKEIIVVDNNSKNESWDILNTNYKDKVHLIKSEENLGFANGNNLGIEYARENLKCSFILLVNNDTIFKDNMLITELVKAYEDGVAIIGPKIIAADGMEQNPVLTLVEKSKVQDTCNKINENQKKNTKSLYIKNNIIYKNLKKIKILRNFKRKITHRNIDKSIIEYLNGKYYNDIVSEDLVLHGACMMLTKDYFKYYNKLFPGTFLYYEENILTLLTKKVGLNKKFVSNVWIYHKEDQSSIMSFNNSNQIKQEYQLNSMKKCLQIFDLSYEEVIERFF